jgi:transposase
MPPQYVKPYVKPSKTGRANAAAIFEAVQRPTMRFVAVKTEDQQGMLVIHRVRDTLVAQRTQLINALRTRPSSNRCLPIRFSARRRAGQHCASAVLGSRSCRAA